jgi:hypothetical protein
MVLRASHGNARDHGALLVVETVPADEQPAASGSDPARRDRDEAGPFLPGNAIATHAKFRAAVMGV